MRCLLVLRRAVRSGIPKMAERLDLGLAPVLMPNKFRMLPMWPMMVAPSQCYGTYTRVDGHAIHSRGGRKNESVQGDSWGSRSRKAVVDEIFKIEGVEERENWDSPEQPRISDSFSRDRPNRGQPQRRVSSSTKQLESDLKELEFGQRKYKIVIAGIKMQTKQRSEIKPAVVAFFEQALQLSLGGENFIMDVGRFSMDENSPTIVTLSNAFIVEDAIKRAQAQGSEGFMFDGRRCYVRPCYSEEEYKKKKRDYFENRNRGSDEVIR